MARVLVVDDDQQVRHLLCRVLIEQGHSVTVASNGDEALDRFASVLPDVLILDLGLPKRDGFSVVRALQDLLTILDTKVLILTGQATEEHSLMAHELGVDLFLAKPFTAEEITESIAAMSLTTSR